MPWSVLPRAAGIVSRCVAILSIAASPVFAGSTQVLMPSDGSTINVATCSGSLFDGGGPSGNYPLGSGFVRIYPDRPGVTVRLELLAADLGAFGAPVAALGPNSATFLDDVGDSVLANVDLRLMPEDMVVEDTAILVSANNTIPGVGGFEIGISCVPIAPLRIGGPELVSPCGVRFTDTGGLDGDYGNSEDLFTRTTVASSVRPFVEWNSFDVEENFDYVRLFDVDGPATPLAEFTGTDTAQTVIGEASSLLRLAFESDSSIIRAGWDAEVGCILEMPSVTRGNADPIQTPEPGMFVTPPTTNDLTYQPDVDLTVDYFTTDFGVDHTIFVNGSLGAGDSVTFRDDQGNSLGALAGSFPETAFFAKNSSEFSKGVVEVEFQSDGSDESTFAMQFVDSFAMTTDRSGRTIETCALVVFDSGGINGNYANDEGILLTLIPRNPAAVLKVEASVNVEAGVDGFLVFDGPNESAPLLGFLTKDDSETFTSAKPGAPLSLGFASDFSNTGEGFTAVVTCSLEEVFRNGFESGDTTAWN